MEGGEEVKCYCLEGGFFFFFLSLGTSRLCFRPTEPDTLILPAYRSTMLTACVFVTRDTVRHPRRFVFWKFVRKPNCSWSEAFVNRGLTVSVVSHFDYFYEDVKCRLLVYHYTFVFTFLFLEYRRSRAASSSVYPLIVRGDRIKWSRMPSALLCRHHRLFHIWSNSPYR